MALSLAAATLGAALVGGASKIYSASQANKASNKALEAQNAASQQQLAAQQAQLDRVYNLNQPFIQGGQGAYSALLAQYGIRPYTAPTSPLEGAGAGVGAQPAGVAANYPGAPRVTPGSGGGFDAATYLAQNPDVAAEAKNHPDMTPEQYAAQHAEQYGKAEGRAIPMNPSTLATTAMPDYMNSQRPTAAPAPTFGDRTNVQMGDFGSAPDMASYLQNFQASPDYQFRLSEGLNGVNAASAVRGKLRSGDAAKALAGYSSNLASGEYGNWFNRQMQQYAAARGAFENDRSYQGNLWNQKQQRSDTNFSNDRAYGTALWQDQRDRTDTNFNTDRAYQTGRYDTNTGNLFSLANVGLNAAGNVSGAGQNYANNATDIYGNNAAAASNAAYNRASANAYGANGIANAAGNLFAAWGGGAATPGISGADGRFGGQTYGAAFTGGGVAALPGNVSGMTYNVPRLF